MQLERKDTPVLVWILGILSAVSIASLFPNFLSTALEKFSFSFPVLLILLLAVLWVAASDNLWWMVFPIFAFWGGLFWIGFKIYPDELGLLVATAALAVALLKDYPTMVRDRPSASQAFLLLALYFLIHMSISLSTYNLGWLSSGGSIIRVYAGGLTYLLFSWMYYAFGTSEHIKWAVPILSLLLLVRIVISILQLYTGMFSDAWGVDLVWIYSSTDLRFSALSQMYFCILLFYLLQDRWAKVITMVFIMVLFLLVFMGEGRVSVGVAISTLLFWMMLAKRLRLLMFISPILLLTIVLVYGDFHLFSHLPSQIQRAISFIPGLESHLLYNTEGSNAWHFDLMALGFQRWTSSFASLIFGNAVDPGGVYLFETLNYLSQLEIAAATGRYESTLWTVLATFGLVGIALYVWIFTFLFREIIPLIRREGIITFNHAVYAVAIICLLQMLFFGWIRGSFPSIELMLGVMAKALYEDNKNANTCLADARSQ